MPLSRLMSISCPLVLPGSVICQSVIIDIRVVETADIPYSREIERSLASTIVVCDFMYLVVPKVPAYGLPTDPMDKAGVVPSYDQIPC